VRGLRVDRSLRSTVDAPMIEVFGQAVAVLWVVTDDVLPLVAGVAGDGVAIILVEAAYAVYLAVVFLLEVVEKSAQVVFELHVSNLRSIRSSTCDGVSGKSGRFILSY
jgi:hypothetical protein